jgi:class 3 adenylate cyclase
VLISDAFATLVDGERLVDLGEHQLKGIARPHRVYGLADEEADGDSLPPGAVGEGNAR